MHPLYHSTACAEKPRGLYSKARMSLAPSPRAPRMNRATVIVALYSALGLLAVGWGWWRGDRNIYEFGERNLTWLVASPIIGLAFGLAMVFLSRLAVHSMEWA